MSCTCDRDGTGAGGIAGAGPACAACPLRDLGADGRDHGHHRHVDTAHDHGDHSDHGSKNHGSKDHGHSHGVQPGADRKYLWIALLLLGGFMVGEVIVALISGSVALLADAGHMLSDVGALAGSLWAISLAARPVTDRWTFGLKRAEILSAAINGITLLVVGALVGVESIGRLIDPPPVDGGPVLVVAIVGVLVNVAATWVLARANRTSLNVEGAFQHVLTDLYAFIGTAIAGLVVVLTGYVRADSIASLLVVALMFRSAWSLLRESGRVLLEAAPKGMSLEDIRSHLLEVPEVIAVHDLHAWTVTSDLPALSAHVVISDRCFERGLSPVVLDHLQECLSGHFDVEHSTFQLEPASHQRHEAGAHH
ncbi:cation diffusion facilitator family transporter [Nakamurella sp. YIM 132087]|uniref:Cation diffusion facilitator family transporter n=1 Tax=Nakamurella alba TaxID=2665158 RepID=A0A7K1FPM8_9ACTN|nr:cation diffusion facilitator family transporter [Nakamurella alba]MTD16096.1 cation diffusion facilitator family transporter [Nakamurella alba]